MRQFILSALTLAAMPGLLCAETLKVDPVHSMAVFKISHMNAGNVYGIVPAPVGTLNNDDGLAMDITIPLEGINSGHPKRDEHLRANDFFNVKQYGTAKFVSTSSKTVSSEEWTVEGELTLKGVTKPVTATVTKVGQGAGRDGKLLVGYEAKFTVDRNDFGIGEGMDMLGATVDVTVAMEAATQ